MSIPDEKPPRGLLFDIMVLIGLAMIWGSSFMVIKIVIYEIPPVSLSALRVTIAMIVLYIFLRIAGRKLPTSLHVWKWYIALGFFGNGLPFFLIGWGEQKVDSGMAAILMSFMPLVTLILAHFFTKLDRFTIPKVIGVSTGFIGVITLIGPETLLRMEGDVLYQLAVVCGGVSYAVSSIIARNTPPAPLLDKATAVYICSCLQMVPLAFIFEHPLALTPDMGTLVWALYLGVLPTGLAGMIYFYLITARGPTFMSYVNYLIPLAGVGFGIWVLGETLTMQAVLALMIILAGVAIANLKFKRKSP